MVRKKEEVKRMEEIVTKQANIEYVLGMTPRFINRNFSKGYFEDILKVWVISPEIGKVHILNGYLEISGDNPLEQGNSFGTFGDKCTGIFDQGAPVFDPNLTVKEQLEELKESFPLAVTVFRSFSNEGRKKFFTLQFMYP